MRFMKGTEEWQDSVPGLLCCCVLSDSDVEEELVEAIGAEDIWGRPCLPRLCAARRLIGIAPLMVEDALEQLEDVDHDLVHAPLLERNERLHR